MAELWLVLMNVKGPYIEDVRTEGGLRIARFWTNSTDRLREMRTKGGGGVENPKNFADVPYVWSLVTSVLAISRSANLFL